MPRILTLLIILVAAFLAPLQSHAETTSELTAPGVSKALAEYRYSNISCVQYRLHFSIPEQGPISGHATITFELEAPTDVILDFKGPKAPTVIVSSAPTSEMRCTAVESSKFVRYENEHIIIPAALTVGGVNSVAIQFAPEDQSFNRRDDLLYTLFVPDRARTAFPCFDQPDMKAHFTLNLEVPEGWKAVSNTVPVNTETAEGRSHIAFAESEPLPTYLFAFAAGKFDYEQYTTADGRTIGAYHRETDAKRVGQLPEIFRQVEHSLRWQEDFTAVKYPFAKYDLVILPGFQFGGMEHTGATFYNANTIFLSEHPTPDEVLSRASLIAHETSHMWFGDFVTMRWFDDVWTKEVFANYFAAEITAPLFPDVNHDLNRLKTYGAAAMSEDRTWNTPLTLSNGEVIRGGGTAIRQPLANLNDAGLVYNNIIYNKSPLVMLKMVEIMGRDAFREGIREYVKTYAYGNATWDDLVAILDRHTPADIRTFSRVWVEERGCPEILLSISPAKKKSKRSVLRIEQRDAYGRGFCWPQRFDVRLLTAFADTTLTVNLDGQDAVTSVPLGAEWSSAQIIPNVDGRGYGVFYFADENKAVGQLARLLANWASITTGTARQSVLMNLEENYLHGRIAPDEWLRVLVAALETEDDALTASTICRYIADPLLCVEEDTRTAFETRLLTIAGTHELTPVRTILIRILGHVATSEAVVEALTTMWAEASNPLLSERDLMNLSLELALRRPAEADSIVSTQRSRLTNPDRQREYDFICRAVSPRAEDREALFAQLLTPEGRRIEPWSATALGYLNHPLRETESVRLVLPALEALEDVQRTGDIFFPGHWCSALLGDHRSDEAGAVVKNFLNAHPDYKPLLRNKILNACWSTLGRCPR